MPVKTLAAATAAAFFAISLYCLYRAHPAEDAFILFKYADNFANGHGIVFNISGPRAEGATDFLWFLLVSVFTAIGLDVAVAAGVVNAIGAGVLTWALVSQVRGSKLLAAFLCLAVLFAGGAVAAYMGFGSVLFAAAVVLLVSRLIDPTRRDFILIPQLALLVGLIRPDGLFFAFAAVIIALVQALRRDTLKPFLISSTAAVALGAIYFAWRYHYFGLLLPLPLYVKGHGGEVLPGLSSHLAWLKSVQGPTLLIILLVIIARFQPWALVLLIPAALHLAAFLFAHHFQNVAYRFQAADFMLIVLTLVVIASRATKHQKFITAALMLALLPAVAGGARNLVRFVTLHNYLDRFAYDLGQSLTRDDTIVLTEAGRLAYWTNADVIDAVGLNTPQTAIAPITVDYLRELDPDVIMFNPAGAANPDSLLPHDPQPVVRINATDLATTVRPPYRPILDADERRSFGQFTAITFAPIVLIKYLAQEHDRYDVYLLAYSHNEVMYSNVIAFKSKLANKDRLIERLHRAFSPAEFRSYAQLKKFPGARRDD